MAVAEATHETMTVLQLREVCKELGITGYSAMKRAEIIDAINARRPRPAVVAVVEPQDTTIHVARLVAEPEVKPTEWKDSFIAELQNICLNLEALPEANFLPQDLLDVVTLVRDAETVEPLAALSEDRLQEIIHILKQQLPRYQREVHETVALIANARAMTVDVDFV